MTTEDSSQDGPPPNGETAPAPEGESPGSDESVATPPPGSTDTSAEGIPSGGIPSDGVPGESAPSDGSPSDSATNESVPNDGASNDSAPNDSAPRIGEDEPAPLESDALAINENAGEASAPSEAAPPETGMPVEASPTTGQSDTESPAIAPKAERTSSTDAHDGSSDAAGISEELPEEPASENQPTALRWDYRRGSHDAAVELKRIETEVRQLLDNCDTRRKRKLGGTHRWHELEEDVMSWRFRGRIDEGTLDRLHCLIARRHHYFKQLRFLSSTRATWNS